MELLNAPKLFALVAGFTRVFLLMAQISTFATKVFYHCYFYLYGNSLASIEKGKLEAM